MPIPGREIEFNREPFGKLKTIWQQITGRTLTSGEIKDSLIDGSKIPDFTKTCLNNKSLRCPINGYYVFPIGICTHCPLGVKGKCAALNEYINTCSDGELDYDVIYVRKIKFKQIRNTFKVNKPKRAIEIDQGKGKIVDLNEGSVALKAGAEYFQIEKVYEIVVEFLLTDTEPETNVPDGKFVPDLGERVLEGKDLEKSGLPSGTLLYQVGEQLKTNIKVKVHKPKPETKTKSKPKATASTTPTKTTSTTAKAKSTTKKSTPAAKKTTK